MEANNKLREAVVLALSLLDLEDGISSKAVSQKDIDFMKAALAEPIKNCEVGTAEEQAHRFHAFCMARQSPIEGMCDPPCPCHEQPDKCHCMTAWAQMPYESEAAR